MVNSSTKLTYRFKILLGVQEVLNIKVLVSSESGIVDGLLVKPAQHSFRIFSEEFLNRIQTMGGDRSFIIRDAQVTR